MSRLSLAKGLYRHITIIRHHFIYIHSIVEQNKARKNYLLRLKIECIIAEQNSTPIADALHAY